MALTQDDIELLEMHLDGELSPSDVTLLTHRLATSSDLAAALHELRAQRDLRAAVWRSFEPNELGAQQLAWRVRGAMADRRQHPFESTSRSLTRWGSALAACIALAFFGGWWGRSGKLNTSTGHPTTPYLVNQPVASANAPVFAPVTNEYGQIVSWQPFQNRDDANRFIEDLNRVHAPTAGTPLDDKINLTSYEKTDQSY